jgi:hypothetical protein
VLSHSSYIDIGKLGTQVTGIQACSISVNDQWILIPSNALTVLYYPSVYPPSDTVVEVYRPVHDPQYVSWNFVLRYSWNTAGGNRFDKACCTGQYAMPLCLPAGKVPD